MMSDIPIPMIHGTTDSEKIRETEAYLSRLSEVLIRELSSISFQNLSQDLSQKINNAVESHQDLSEYASKRYVKDNFIDNEEIASYATESWVSGNFVYDSTFSNLEHRVDELVELVNGLGGSVSNHSASLAEIDELLNGDGYFNKGIIKRLKAVEEQLGI